MNDDIALDPHTLYPFAAYRDEYGDVTWWVYPLLEPVHIGRPSDTNWPLAEYLSHWSPIP